MRFYALELELTQVSVPGSYNRITLLPVVSCLAFDRGVQHLYLVVLLHTLSSHGTTNAKLRLLPEIEALDVPQIRSGRQHSGRG